MANIVCVTFHDCSEATIEREFPFPEHVSDKSMYSPLVDAFMAAIGSNISGGRDS